MTPRQTVHKLIRNLLRPTLKMQESRLVKPGDSPLNPPTFIVGAPRSGTTVAYQLMTSQINASYISNFAESFPQFPAAATRLIRRQIRNYRSNFTSNYGRTQSRAGPSEGYMVWQRWFRWKDGRDAQICSEDDCEAIATIAALESILGGPFISKDPHHCGRILALGNVFPNCVFLWIRRDPAATAQSLLTARRLSPRLLSKQPHDYIWWGYRPKAFNKIRNKDYIDQVCEQVYYAERDIVDGLNGLGSARCLQIRYEHLCRDPSGQLARIKDFMRHWGVPARSRGHDLPDLNVVHTPQVCDEEAAAIRAKCEALYADPTLVLSGVS